jgi:hypothetical protein
MTPEQILEELEAQMAELSEFSGATFEMLEDYAALADTRLSVFRSERLWALAIEAVRYDAGADQYNLDIWLYGNCLKPREEFFDLSRALFVAPHAWNREIETGVWGFARDGFAIRWRGQRYNFAPSLEELEAAGIKLSRREITSGLLSPQQALRYVCHALDHPFFASEDTLRDLLDRRRFDSEWKSEGEGENIRVWVKTPLGDFDEYPVLGCDLELFLQTRDWRHPKQGTSPEDEISVRDAFEPLAQALASGDLAAWPAQDPARFNSHWSFWAGTEWQTEQLFDQERVALIAEGERFQELLRLLPEKEREETIRVLKEDWEEQKRETLRMSQQFYPGMSYTSYSTIEIEGQFFTFGPHLWGEVDDTIERALENSWPSDFEGDNEN